MIQGTTCSSRSAAPAACTPADLSEDLEVGTVLVPRNPGLLSAYGLLVSDFRREFVRTELTRIADLKADRVLEVFAELENRGPAGSSSATVSPGDGIVPAPSVDLRYVGQELDLNIPVDPARVAKWRIWLPPSKNFHLKPTIGGVRSLLPGRRGRGRELSPDRDRTERGAPDPVRRRDRIAEQVKTGEVYIGRALGRLCLLRATAAAPGRLSRPDGPMVVEEATATTFVPPGWRVSVDGWGNLVLTRA